MNRADLIWPGVIVTVLFVLWAGWIGYNEESRPENGVNFLVMFLGILVAVFWRHVLLPDDITILERAKVYIPAFCAPLTAYLAVGQVRRRS